MINYSGIAKKHQSDSFQDAHNAISHLGQSLDIATWKTRATSVIGGEECLRAPAKNEVPRLLDFLSASEDIVQEPCILNTGPIEDPDIPTNFYRKYLLANRGAMRALVPHIPVANVQKNARDRVTMLFRKIERTIDQGDAQGYLDVLEKDLGIQLVRYGDVVSTPKKVTLYNMHHGGMHFMYLMFPGRGYGGINMTPICDCCEGPATGILSLKQFSTPLV